MTAWSAADTDAITTPQEVQVLTRRQDGTLRSPRTIWIVQDDGRIFIRSTNGPGADWYRAALATGTGQILVGTTPYETQFVKADDEDLAAADHAYRAKYGHYARIVDHLVGPQPRSTTLEVQPA